MSGFFDSHPPDDLSDEEKEEWWKAKRRDDRWSNVASILVFLTLVGLIVIASLIHARWFYGN